MNDSAGRIKSPDGPGKTWTTGKVSVAILQEYRKVRETEEEVDYLFGFPEKDRQLTIYKEARTFWVTDGQEDHATLAVVRGILRRQQTDGTWPNGGGIQH
jgi:hypothetical protein